MANFLQCVQADEKSCTLEILSGAKAGYMHFRGGDLVNANSNGLNGEEAALDILSWKDSKISIDERIHETECIIKLSLTFLLMESIRRAGEQKSPIPDNDRLGKAVKFADAHRFKKAVEELKHFLKENPENSEGWLWFSRCTNMMQTSEKALRKAVKLAPDDPTVKDEWERFEKCRSSLNSGRIRRCPICWTPLSIKAVQCIFCNAFLHVPRNHEYPEIDTEKSKLFDKAVERYTRITENENDLNAVFFLSIAFYNLQKMDEAISNMRQAVSLSPGNKFFENQLSLLEGEGLLNSDTTIASAEKRDEEPDVESDTDDTPDVSKKKVLVVEDSPTTRKVVVTFLEQSGFDTIEAEDGFEALGKLNEDSPDAVLLDIILPKMDGYKILSVIRDNEELKQIPVIMLTSKDGLINKMKGKLAGSTAYLTKPVNHRELLKTLNTYL
ncbi:MAG: response regulator [Desulfobacteraceae bacterium]|nr:response regulator [Desulfobacteraceae bacterium]